MENWCVHQAYTGFVLGMPTLERPMISSFLGVDFANRFFKMAKKVHMYGPKHSVQSNKTTTAYCSHTFGIGSSNVWGLGYVLVFGMPTLTRDIFVSLQLAISVCPSIEPHNPKRTFYECGHEETPRIPPFNSPPLELRGLTSSTIWVKKWQTISMTF